MSALRFLTACLLPAAALTAGDRVPSGFTLETITLAPLAAVLEDGTELFSTGTFPNDELTARAPDGMTQLYATGFGSLAGVAQSPVSGFQVAGDSANATALWLLRDLNDDGNCLGPGEMVAFDPQPPVLTNAPTPEAPLPFDVVYRPGTDELYMSGSTPTDGYGAVTRSVGGVVTVYAEGFGFAGDMVWDGDVLYLGDVEFDAMFNATGFVYALQDLNDDGDALDSGEVSLVVGDLPGSSGLQQAADGALYVGTGFGGTVARVVPDGTGPALSVELDYFTGFGFAALQSLVEGPGGFVPGVAGNGELRVGDFANGDVRIRSAPFATLEVDGEVANNSAFDVVVKGTPLQEATFILSFDPVGVTLPGVADLAVGFDAPWAIAPLKPLDDQGCLRVGFAIHGQPGLVGQSLAIQGFTLEDDRWGVSNGIVSVIAP